WRAAYPDMDIFAVEPEHFDDTARSFRSGQRERNAPGHTSVCDSIITEMPGALTFPINVANGVQAAVVRDIDALRAVAFAYEELKLVVEPGGAVALAVLLFGGLDLAGKTVVATLSGGNIDPAMLQRALET
ncbi:MAG: pyridoxal-phosphate dependent enzyme, partial [Devosiaceae bacterium]|nr:pyridoxal-phosphate dependent enzyme [Devosiaceae bacterium MH13]